MLALLVAASLAAACSDGDGGAAPGPGAAPTTVPGAAPDAAGPGSGPDPAVEAGDPDAPVAEAPGPGVPGPTTTPAGSPPSTPAAVPEPGPVGSFAAWYLRPDASASLVVRVLAQEGAAPEPATVQHVAAALAAVAGKPVSATDGSLGGGERLWTADELRSLADADGASQTPDRAVLTLLYVRGGSAENERAVGLAVRSDVAAVFAERVDEAAGMLGDRAAVEQAVSLHEVGHLLGLVDLVLDTGRADPEHPGHSPNRSSVMYYAVESTLLGSVLAGGPPRQFDQADLDDLARIRNG